MSRAYFSPAALLYIHPRFFSELHTLNLHLVRYKNLLLSYANIESDCIYKLQLQLIV